MLFGSFIKHFSSVLKSNVKGYHCYPGGNYLLIVNNKDTIIVPEENFLVSLLTILNRYFPAGYYFKFSAVTMESKKNVICCNFFETNLPKSASQS